MSKIISIAFLFLFIFVSCLNKKHKKETKNERVEIVAFYKNSVMVKDLNLIDTNLFLVEKEEFLDNKQSKILTDAIWTLVRNPKSNVYDASGKVMYSSEVLRNWFIRCDSVEPVDSLNNVIGPAFIVCDSTSLMEGISKIYFYETWYHNTNTNLIEKETLGYSVWSYVPFKEAFKEIFVVFRDDAARERCKKYYFSD